jgi:Fe-S cluster assembly protein SufD
MNAGLSPFLASVERAQTQAAGALAADAEAQRVRRSARDRFVAAGLPGARDENWKYLILRGLARSEWVLAPPSAATARAPEGLLTMAGATRLVFVDGRFNAGLSSPRKASPVTRIETLTELYARAPELLASAVPVDDRADTRFALLNTAFAMDGASVEIEGGESPLIYLVFIATGSTSAQATFPRIRIRATRGASSTIVEHHVADGGGSRFVNSLAEIEVDDSSRVDLCRLHALAAEARQFDTLRARVGARSTFALHSLMVGGDIVRSDVDVALNGAAAAGQINGLMVTADTQHHELHAELRHAVPHTTSRTHVRAVVNDSGRSICNSKVIVAPGAKGSVSEQNFRNLLLASGAEADTRPQLEINNEDVKCSHGASTGRLDPNMLFYLLSRGIDAAMARGLLTYAFVIDLLKDLPVDELSRTVARRVAGTLPGRDLIKDFI